MSVPADLFRDIFQRWPSGVAVATSLDGDRPHGMVVGSFCSLSLDPPRVMMSAGTITRMHDILDQHGRFAINILSNEHHEILNRFAGLDRSHDDDRFAGLEVETTPSGLAIFPDAIAWVECEVLARHRGDGYTIFVADLVNGSLGESSEADPMVYVRRAPRRVELAEPVLPLP